MKWINQTASLLFAVCLGLATNVAAGPNIVMQPANQRTYAGGNVMFSAYSDDTNALSYQWFKGGNEIAGATDARLVLRNVSDADVGTYLVTVSDGTDTTVSSNAVLTLYADGNVIGVSGYFNTNLASLSRIKAVVYGFNHGLALRHDGKLLTFGWPTSGQYPGPYNIFSYLPQGLTTACAIAVSYTSFGMALETNGTPRVWACEASRELPVPAEARDVVDIAATGSLALALRADGTVVCWPFNTNVNAFIPDPITDAVAISAKSEVASVLRRDGTVLEWNQSGMIQFTEAVTNVCKLAAGDVNSVAMLQDGDVVYWFHGGGYNSSAQTNLMGRTITPPTDVVELIPDNVAILSSDGSIMSLAGIPPSPIAPPGLGPVEHVSPAENGSVAIRQGDTPVISYLYMPSQLPRELPFLLGASVNLLPGQPNKIVVVADGRPPLSYQWFKNGKVVAGATSSALSLRGLTTETGSYTVQVRNRAGATMSQAVAVSIEAPALTVSGAPSVRTTNDTVHFEGTYPVGNTLTIATFPAVRTPPPPLILGQTNIVAYPPAPTLETNGSIVTWSVDIPLYAGTNTFGFWNAGPDQGPIIVREVYRVATSRLTVTLSGSGSVYPNLNGRQLEVGKTYTMTAYSGAGYYFSGWNESSTNSPVLITGNLGLPFLTFTMASNLVVTANFNRNPYPDVKGLYRGLVFSSDGIEHDTSGYLEVLVDGSGSFTARLIFGGITYRFSGSFRNPAPSTIATFPGTQTVVYLPRPGKVPLTVFLSLSGQGYVTDNYTTSAFWVEKSEYTPDEVGRYTVVFPGVTNNAGPFGNGYATVTVNAAGAVTMVGQLADGTAISQSTAVLSGGEWPLYVPLYNGKGSIISFGLLQSIGFNALANWSRPGDPKGGLFAQGFTNEFSIATSKYSSTGNIFTTNQASIFVQSEDGNVNLVDPCAISSAGVLSINPSSGDDLRIYVNRSTGSFSGSFVAPDTKQVVPVHGVILENQDQAFGYFLRTNQSGAIWMQ